MPAERFYSPFPFKTGNLVSIEGQEFHHAIKVMRTRLGDEVELVNGQGDLAKGTCKEILRGQALFFLNSISSEATPGKALILAQALPRLNRLETIIEKTTELGVTEIWLFPGEGSEKKTLTANQFERLEGISIGAMKQSGRLYLPKILMHPPISQWKKPTYPLFFGDLDAKMVPAPQLSDVVVVIGPERGFAKNEVETLKELGGKGIKFHNNTLRTDTAAIISVYLYS